MNDYKDNFRKLCDQVESLETARLCTVLGILMHFPDLKEKVKTRMVLHVNRDSNNLSWVKPELLVSDDEGVLAAYWDEETKTLHVAFKNNS